MRQIAFIITLAIGTAVFSQNNEILIRHYKNLPRQSPANNTFDKDIPHQVRNDENTPQHHCGLNLIQKLPQSISSERHCGTLTPQSLANIPSLTPPKEVNSLPFGEGWGGVSTHNNTKQKTRKTKTICLDSIVSEKIKTTYFYDNNGNNTLTTKYSRDNSNETWKENSKNEYTYDNNGKIVVFIYYNWENNAWKGNQKNMLTRNNNGYITLEIRYVWDDSKNNWVENFKNEYAYDTNGYQTMSATYTWDNSKNNWEGYRKNGAVFDANGTQFMRFLWDWNYAWRDWELMYKDTTIFTFDTNGILISDADYAWENNAWHLVPSWKREYEYDTNGYRIGLICYFYLEYYYKDEVTRDSNGNQILGIKYSWTNNDWLFAQKVERDYDSNRYVILAADYSWDTTRNLWIGYYKREVAYHNDVLIMETRYRWNFTDNDWLGYYKGEAIYDNNGNQSLLISYNWDNINNAWKAYGKSESVFDLSYFVDDVIFPDELYFTYSWLTTLNNNIAIERIIYDWIADDWENTDIRKYYYSTHNVGITEPQATVHKIFPNPAKTQFTVTNTANANLYLYNMVGQEVLRTYGTEENSIINVNFLPQGLYILKVVKDGVVNVHKIVIND